MIDAEEHGNKIAFAVKGEDFMISKQTLLERIRELGPQHPIPLHYTAQKILQRLHAHTCHLEWELLLGLGA